MKKFLEKKFPALGIRPAEKARLSLQRGPKWGPLVANLGAYLGAFDRPNLGASLLGPYSAVILGASVTAIY